MKKDALRLWLSTASLASFILIFATSVSAQKFWVSPTSGLWRDGANWSGGTPPFSTNNVTIANTNSKVVTIDAATPSANLTITRLNLWGPNNFTNTLII